MKKLSFLAAAFAALMFTACEKEDSTTNNPGNGGGSTSRLLKKLTKTENNETTVYSFTYDASKRLTSYKSDDNVEQVSFTYDATGNIVKVEEVDGEYKNIYAYTYSNSVPVSGSFKSWQKHAGEPDELIEDDILTYTLENNLVKNIHLEMTQDGTEMDFTLSYTNGNLTKVESVNNEFFKAIFTYGNKKSPFPNLSKYVLDQAGFSLQYFARNELTSATYDFPGTELDRTIATQYTYDAAGFPLTSNDGVTQYKYEYQ